MRYYLLNTFYKVTEIASCGAGIGLRLYLLTSRIVHGIRFLG